ncbi:SGNH/GDSL hydrolase family protein [Ruficoccus sp. ZRK36]|uniref:SGNH/GDSL hydrolase family protein n=1 Tax=Ruficoccus sp. ZRK36 TaxID=2866311 RepID=UPI001C732135|nr:SGNH/GDSL hydrolase family protein [Ruficoccus sp. ZRK36]QYY35949.1 SGNH/GDSL hydrolase family protein [Ruficoccus sp. ZRK36]
MLFTNHFFRSAPIAGRLLTTALLGLLALSAAHADTSAPRASVFKDGDRYAIVGDSITQSGTYHTWVALYYTTRFPQLDLALTNCGISGDSTGGTLRRYGWDIAPFQPTVATVMLGMNDIGRDKYGQPNPPQDVLDYQMRKIEAYKENMTKLVKQLQDDGARVVLVTPSPYDDTADLPSESYVGANAALGECADFLTQMAADSNGEIELIDLHGPLTALNLEQQKTDPSFTITGPDRVHPQSPGHLAMAYFFLKAQGAPAEVSAVGIDASKQSVTVARNAKVSDVTYDAAKATLSFTSLEGAIPFSVSEYSSPALEYIDFNEDLNREMLTVANLPAGSYTISIDGQPVGEACSWSAEELASGINLSTLDDTPQARQAAKVRDIVVGWWSLMLRGDRTIANVEHWHLRDIPHPIAFEDVQAGLEEKLARLEASDKRLDKLNAKYIKRYLEMKPKQEEIEKELPQMIEQARAAAQPVPHTYVISPAQS